MTQWITWWLWRRWTIFVPKRDVSHLFKQDWQSDLIGHDEVFVSPCSFNEVNSGQAGNIKIRMIGLEPDERMQNE